MGDDDLVEVLLQAFRSKPTTVADFPFPQQIQDWLMLFLWMQPIILPLIS